METTKEERDRWLKASMLIGDVPIIAKLCRDIEELEEAQRPSQVDIAKTRECDRLADENRMLRARIAEFAETLADAKDHFRKWLRLLEDVGTP